MRRRFLENAQFNYMRYMTIEVLEDGLLIQVPSSVEYTIGGNWETLEANDSREFYKGQFVSFKKTYTFGRNFGTFVIKGMCNLRGNCMSMVFGDSGYKNNDLSELYQPFCAMFENCNGIVSVDPTFLPATTLASHCYDSMFLGCTSLTTAPELPATTLAEWCYDSMFLGCTSLTTAPELPATTLAGGCYYSMFWGCTKLNYIKMLATDISAPGCLDFWVQNVALTGTFVKNPNMTSLPKGNSGIPYGGWTVINDGEESGGGKIVNHGHIGQSTGYYIEWEYPVSSLISVVFNIYSPFGGDSTYELPTSINASKSYSPITFGPGESLDSLRSITPIEDSTYIYEIIIEE